MGSMIFWKSLSVVKQENRKNEFSEPTFIIFVGQ